jgi:hypothetical protein
MTTTSLHTREQEDLTGRHCIVEEPEPSLRQAYPNCEDRQDPKNDIQWRRRPFIFWVKILPTNN